MLIHYGDYIVLLGPVVQEVATTLNTLPKYTDDGEK